MAITILEHLTGEQVAALRGDDKKLFKVNLRRDPNSFNGEGIWAVARNAEDWEKYAADAEGVEIPVVCLNDTFSGLVYGDVFVAKLRGKERPASLDITDK